MSEIPVIDRDAIRQAQENRHNVNVQHQREMIGKKIREAQSEGWMTYIEVTDWDRCSTIEPEVLTELVDKGYKIRNTGQAGESRTRISWDKSDN